MQITQIVWVRGLLGMAVLTLGVGVAVWAEFERTGMVDWDLTNPQTRLSDCLFAKLVAYETPLLRADIEEIVTLAREADEAKVTAYTRWVYGLFALQALGAIVSAIIVGRFVLGLGKRPARVDLGSEPKLIVGRS